MDLFGQKEEHAEIEIKNISKLSKDLFTHILELDKDKSKQVNKK
jgi:hypothetical protein